MGYYICLVVGGLLWYYGIYLLCRDNGKMVLLWKGFSVGYILWGLSYFLIMNISLGDRVWQCCLLIWGIWLWGMVRKEEESGVDMELLDELLDFDELAKEDEGIREALDKLDIKVMEYIKFHELTSINFNKLLVRDEGIREAHEELVKRVTDYMEGKVTKSGEGI